MIKRIGIDIGGVIIDRAKNDGTDTSFFSDNYLNSTAVKGAFDTIRQLVDAYGAENVFIVSKCGDNIRRKSREWLGWNKFYDLTGFREENLRFCKRRWEKAPICEELGITHFIDDRFDCLEPMKGVIKILFTPEQTDLVKGLNAVCRIVEGWHDIDHMLTRDTF